MAKKLFLYWVYMLKTHNCNFSADKTNVFQYPKSDCYEHCYKSNPAVLPPAQHGKGNLSTCYCQ